MKLFDLNYGSSSIIILLNRLGKTPFTESIDLETDILCVLNKNSCSLAQLITWNVYVFDWRPTVLLTYGK